MSAATDWDISCTRSVPLRCAAEVNSAFHPLRWQTAIISSESVAIITSCSRGEDLTALYTRPIRGWPPISRSILRGILVDARRAGMTATALMGCCGSHIIYISDAAGLRASPQRAVWRALPACSLLGDERLTPLELRYILMNSRVADPRSLRALGSCTSQGLS